MKRTIIALLTVATLVMMMLPADIEAARGGRGHGPAATNETIESLVADFDFDIPECPLCEGVMFTDRSSGGASPYTYDWDFGDGSNSTEENPTHGYADYGNYTVTLTVTDSASDVASEIKTITVAPQETTVEPFGSDISTTGATGTWPRCISGCTANDASITYIWLEANPSCTPGANTSAELWATFEINRSHGVCCLVSVVDIYVDGHFVDDYVTRVGDFLSAGTYDVKIADVIWPCGSVMTLRDIYAQWIPKGGQPCPTCDGNCDDYDIPSKCYYDPGPYEVPAPLIADFDYEGVCFCDDCNTSFTDTTTGGVEPYTSWYWDFGDSSGTSTEQNPLYHYDSAGTYIVTLNVTDYEGIWDIESHSVTVHPNPTVDAGADESVCAGAAAFNLTGESPSGGTWSGTGIIDANDGTFDPVTAGGAGNYTITYSYTDGNGCSNSDTKNVEVYALPVATASSNSPVSQGSAIQLTGGPAGMASYYWTGPGGWTSSDQNPTRTGATTAMAGTYTLTVTNDNGCTDDATTNVVVTVPVTPTGGGGGGCPTTKYLTCDWEGRNTTEPLYSNDKLAVDLLGPSPDDVHNLLLEQGTHAPVVDETTYYLIVVRELEHIPPLPENTEAIVVFNITPTDAVFDKDIFLTLGLNETQLPGNALNVTMDYYDEISGAWLPLEYETGGPNGVAELTFSAPINHFSIYGILAELGPTTPPQAAHFVPSGLSIRPSLEETVFVTKTGESVTITATVANDGGQEGTYDVVLKLNGQTIDTKTVTVGAGQSRQVSFTESGLGYGQYEVDVAGLTGEFTASRTVAWWLIILIIAGMGSIIWGIVWRRRRRKAQQEA